MQITRYKRDWNEPNHHIEANAEEVKKQEEANRSTKKMPETGPVQV